MECDSDKRKAKDGFSDWGDLHTFMPPMVPYRNPTDAWYENLDQVKHIINRKIRSMDFKQVIDGLKEGKCFYRMAWDERRVITKQIPADIPSEIIPKMQSLSDNAKTLVLSQGDRQIHYRTQVIQIKVGASGANIATYYVPTWEDIFADDWHEM